MAIIDGSAQGIDDVLVGTANDDQISGFSGDDVLRGARGDDTLIGGKGSDVMFGGLDADTFQFSAGHLDDGAIDYIADFSLNQGDTLKFLDSANDQIFEVLSIIITKLSETEFNGVDLRNDVLFGHDVVFTVRNSETGAVQDIAVLDSWSAGLNQAWVDYLDSLGLSFS